MRVLAFARLEFRLVGRSVFRVLGFQALGSKRFRVWGFRGLYLVFLYLNLYALTPKGALEGFRMLHCFFLHGFRI